MKGLASRLLYSNFAVGVVGRWLSRLDRLKARVLKASLKACGDNVTFHLPVKIEGPHLVEIGSDVDINAFVHIWGSGGVKIGNRVLIASHAAITSRSEEHTS